MQIIIMIISFDGNVFCGKTTLIKKLSSTKGYNIISEYSEFIDKIKPNKAFKNTQLREQLRYLKIDKVRLKKIKSGINLLDRSFVSMSAHVYAAYKCRGIDIRKKYLELLEEYMKRKKIIIPDKFIFLSCSFALAKKRFLRGFKDKKTEKFYIEKKYFNAIENFNKTWIKSAGGLFINSSIKSPEKNKKLIKFSTNKRTSLSCSESIRILKELMELK